MPLDPEFGAWCAAQGLLLSGVQVAHVRDGGRGLVATHDLPDGHTFLQVPEACLVSCRSARRDPRLGPLLEEQQHQGLDSYQVLAAHLLHEVHKAAQAQQQQQQRQQQQGQRQVGECSDGNSGPGGAAAPGPGGGTAEGSRWGEYLRTLPRAYTSLASWGQAAVEALQVPYAREAARDAAQRCHAQWRQARPLLEALGVAAKYRALGAWRWAAATLLSRTMFVPWDEAGALTPLGDMLNHQSPPPPCTTRESLLKPPSAAASAPCAPASVATAAAAGTRVQAAGAPAPGAGAAAAAAACTRPHPPAAASVARPASAQPSPAPSPGGDAAPPSAASAAAAAAAPSLLASCTELMPGRPGVVRHTSVRLDGGSAGAGAEAGAPQQEQAVSSAQQQWAAPAARQQQQDEQQQHEEIEDAGGGGRWGDGSFDSGTGMYQLTTRRRYARGQQVYVSYGAHSNLELLSLYGFVLPANAHDVAPLPLPLVEAALDLALDAPGLGLGLGLAGGAGDSAREPAASAGRGGGGPMGRAAREAAEAAERRRALAGRVRRLAARAAAGGDGVAEEGAVEGAGARLVELGLLQRECYLHADGSPSWSLLQALRAAACTPQERARHAALLAANERVTAAGDLAAAWCVRQAAAALLAALPTSLEQDEWELEALAGASAGLEEEAAAAAAAAAAAGTDAGRTTALHGATAAEAATGGGGERGESGTAAASSAAGGTPDAADAAAAFARECLELALRWRIEHKRVLHAAVRLGDACAQLLAPGLTAAATMRTQ